MADRRKDQETDEHPDTSGNERLSPAVMLNQIQSNKGNFEIYHVQDHLGDKRFNLHRFENGCTVVEEVIGAGKLLKSLQGHTQCNTIGHPCCFEDSKDPTDSTRFGAQLALNLVQLDTDGVVVLGSPVDPAQCFFGFLCAAEAVGIAGGFGEE